MGAYDIDHKHGKELTANYIIPYEKGELKAVAYDENGNIIAEDMQRSFGDAVRIEAVPDKALTLFILRYQHLIRTALSAQMPTIV